MKKIVKPKFSKLKKWTHSAVGKVKRFSGGILKELKKLRPQNFLLLIIAGIINACGVTLFLSPVSLYDSGVSGTSMLLAQITPEQLTFSLFLIVLNVPLFLFGMKRQGIVFTIYSIWTVAIYSLASAIITNVLPIDVSSASPFAGSDLLLCAIFGGLISGLGSGLTIRFGGAVDGMEVLAVIFAKPLGLSVGNFVMVYNVILYILIGIVRQSWILPLYSIITYAVGNKAVDFIVEGLDKEKSVMIVTSQEEVVCKAISDEFGRGITLINAKGYYSGADKCLVYFVVNRFQIPKVKNIVHEMDPYAFITITEISDVLATSVKQK